MFPDMFGDGDGGAATNRRGIDDFGVQDFSRLPRRRPLRPWSLSGRPRLRCLLWRGAGPGGLLLLGNFPQQVFQFAHDAHDGRPPATALVAIALRISVSAWTLRSLK
jgi:hypothetical protein